MKKTKVIVSMIDCQVFILETTREKGAIAQALEQEKFILLGDYIIRSDQVKHMEFTEVQ